MSYLLKDKQAILAQSQYMWLQNKTQQNKSKFKIIPIPQWKWLYFQHTL